MLQLKTRRPKDDARLLYKPRSDGENAVGAGEPAEPAQENGGFLPEPEDVSEPDGESWAEPPFVPGDWTRLRGEAADELRHAIEATPVIGPLHRRIGRMRARALEFYGDWLMIETEVHDAKGRLGTMVVLFGEDGVVPIDGRSETIHAVNPHALSLKDDAAVLNYARFFCNALRGDEARFRIIDTLADIPWKGDVDLADMADEIEDFAPLRLVSALGWNEPARIEAAVLYADALFVSQLSVAKNGLVIMEDDAVIADDLPVELEVFDGPVKLANDRRDMEDD